MVKRPLLPTVLLFLLGIYLAAYDVNIGIIIFSCLMVCLVIYFRTKQQLFSIIAVLLILLGIGRMNIAEIRRNRIISRYAGKMDATLTVSDFSDDNNVTAYFKDCGKRYKVRLQTKEPADLSPGDIIKAEILLKRPFNTEKPSFDMEKNLAGNGIFLLAETENLTKTGDKEKGVMGLLYSLRTYADALGKRTFQNNDRALFNAMIFGDKSLISKELYSALQSSGLNHIAVVSGMHFSVAILFFLFISRKILGNSRRSYLPVIFFSFFLTILTGGGASVIRACFMSCFFLLSGVLFRHEDSPTSLGVTVLVMTVVNPYIVFNIGFLLSVFAVLGILLFHRRFFGFFIKFVPESLASVLSISISAQLTVTLPAVYYFGTVAPYSLFTNTLIVPFAGVYVILGMIFVILSPIPFVSGFVAFVMKIISSSIARVCFAVKKFPFSLTEIGIPVIIFAVIWTFVCVMTFFHQKKRKKRRFSSRLKMK